MSITKRNGKKWTIHEVLSLHREHELLGWTVQKIAEKHKRSVSSIVYKLDKENIIESREDIKGFNVKEFKNSNGIQKNYFYVSEDEEDDSDYDAEDDVSDSDAEESEYLDDGEDSIEESVEYKENDSLELDKLSERIWRVETSVADIRSVVKELLDTLLASSTAPKNSLLEQPVASFRIN